MNTCAALAESLGLSAIALYAHILPATIAVFLGSYAVAKTRVSKLSVVFLFFALAVALWLIADVILWTVPDYTLVAFFWSWIDFVNVTFFVLAAYFFGILARGSISRAEKGLLFALCLPAFFFTVTGNAVTGFDHTWCEMFNNEHSVSYKSFAEGIAILSILASLVIAWKNSDRAKRNVIRIVVLALLLFLGTFSVTEYIAARTAVYEINLYGLFALPVFLIVMVFAVTNLEVFKIRYLGTQVLIYVLIILVASQLLFLESSTDATLNAITLAISVSIGIMLLRNERRELDSLLAIENLAHELSATNAKLTELDQMKSQFLSFASHQLRTPLTAIKWQAQLLLDGTTGKLPKAAQDVATEIEESSDRMVSLVNEFLNLRKLQEGRMDYAFEPVDIPGLITEITNELKRLAEHKGLALTFEHKATHRLCAIDRQKFSQVLQNLIDNAIKYTDTGSVTVSTQDEAGGLMNILVTDTGHGIDPSLTDTLFEQFVRDRKDAARIEGTGLGLYIARRIVEAHQGRIWATSPGPGKGSTFFIQLKTLDR